MNFNIKLNVDQINYIISSLSKQPYEDVAELIETIRYQAMEQINQSAKEEPPAAECDTCAE